MPAERLQKLIAEAGIASRRAAEQLIRDGRVVVDGEVAELGQRADLATQRVTVDGRAVTASRSQQTLMLHKPEGVLVTRRDERGRRTIYDLLDTPSPGLRYVGRLDRDSSGLLLLTTDGQLQHRVTHPRYGLEKVYEAILDAPLGAEAAARLRRGVELADGVTAPARVEELSPSGGRPRVRITIHEGRNRQVRRMFETVDRRVERLRRVAIGPLRLGGLARGQARELTAEELQRLRAAVGLG